MKQSLFLLTLLMFAPFGIMTILRGPTITLADGLGQVIEFVDTTASIVANDREITPRTQPANPDPATASRLKNNYSFADQSSWKYPGYNDCDSWKNIIIDGWSANYAVVMEVQNERDGIRLLDKVKQYWESLGYQVDSYTYANEVGTPWSTSLLVFDGTMRYQFDVDWMRNEAFVNGNTGCLRPG